MIGQHYGSKSSNSSVKLGYLHTPGFSRAELRLGNSFLLGIFGISGLASGLGNITGASGYFWHANRCKPGERREEMNKTLGCPRKPFIEAEPRTYAGRTGPRNVTAYVSEATCCDVDTFGVRGAYLGSDRWLLRIMLPNFQLNLITKYLINFGNSYLLHTNSVFDVLYIHGKVRPRSTTFVSVG